MRKTAIARATLTGLWLAASLLAPREAQAALSSGLLITNFVSATYSLTSGDEIDNSDPGISILNCGPHTATTWVLVTDTPVLCMQGWKDALSGPSGPSLGSGTASPGDLLCFEIGFSNCGDFTGWSVHITDVLPANVVKGPSFPGNVWVAGGYVTISTPWSSSLAGPWYTTGNAGQVAPLYMRWLLQRVGLHKSGYIRYCVTVL